MQARLPHMKRSDGCWAQLKTLGGAAQTNQYIYTVRACKGWIALDRHCGAGFASAGCHIGLSAFTNDERHDDVFPYEQHQARMAEIERQIEALPPFAVIELRR